MDGIGVMLHFLGGGSEHSASEYYGRKISEAFLDEEENRLHIYFDDGVKIVVFDDGQSCCESRYMRTDDEVKSLVGGRLVKITIKDAPDQEDEYGDVHEIMFMEIQTDKNFITLSNHNEHNGYYGGFGMTIREIK